MSTQRKPPAAAATRTFRLRDDGQEDGVKRVSLGCAPRISLGLGETFMTADETLAGRLARDPHLEQVQA